jgi:multidrug efflux system outer membrane protein
MKIGVCEGGTPLTLLSGSSPNFLIHCPRRQTSPQEVSSPIRKPFRKAFREVSDVLIGYQRSREFLTEQQVLTQTLADADRLARTRYQGGVTSYLEVLQQEIQYFTTQLDLAQARLSELTSVVQLYQTLGGGWQ